MSIVEADVGLESFAEAEVLLQTLYDELETSRDAMDTSIATYKTGIDAMVDLSPKERWDYLRPFADGFRMSVRNGVTSVIRQFAGRRT